MAGYLRLLILGPPGSGKGTIGIKIAKKYNLQHIASGDTLRDHVKTGTSIGIKVQSIIHEGKLVPDELITELMLSEIKGVGKGWILDGFPRTLEQGKALVNNQPSINAAIYLNVPFEVIVSRVKDRWIHSPSGRVYNLQYNSPKVPGKDDVTGESLIQRSDDHPKVVQERLNQYQQLTKPLLDFYKEKNLLVTFTGTKSDEILPEIHQYVTDKLL
jgi:nucleoside-triphosphate--adenylate kinase